MWAEVGKLNEVLEIINQDLRNCHKLWRGAA
jgi:hypothetical protein